METESSFNLEEAIAQWRNELAAEPCLTHDNLRELESHLRESIADAVSDGISRQVAFEQAIKEIGPSITIQAEFARENRAVIWKQRLFWMTLALLTLPVLSNWLVLFCSSAIQLFSRMGLSNSGAVIFLALKSAMPVMMLGVLAAPALLLINLPTQRFRWLRTLITRILSRPTLFYASATLYLAVVIVRYFGRTIGGPLEDDFSIQLWLHMIPGYASFLALNLIAITVFAVTYPSVRDQIAGSTDQSDSVWFDRTKWMALGWLALSAWTIVSSGFSQVLDQHPEHLTFKVMLGVLLPFLTLLFIQPLIASLDNRSLTSVKTTHGRPTQKWLTFSTVMILPVSFWVLSAHSRWVDQIFRESSAPTSMSISTPVLLHWVMSFVVPVSILFAVHLLRARRNDLRHP